jgi:hypothetical protein
VSGSGRVNGARPFVTIRPWLRAGLLRHLSPTASRILFLVTDYCGTDGYSYPAVKTLAEKSGHSRKVIYQALQELVRLGCLKRAGQTRWSSHNHPGPIMYAIVEYTWKDGQRLQQLDAKRHPRGDATRFRKTRQAQEHLSPSEVFQTQEHLNGSRCTSEYRQGIPSDALQGVLENTRKVSQPQGHTEHSQSLRTRAYAETPPKSPPGGTCSSSGGPSAERASDNGSGNGNGKRATKVAERMREDVRRLFEAEATVGNGLKSLEHYQRWFPKTYDPAMVAEVFHEVQRANGC